MWVVREAKKLTLHFLEPAAVVSPLGTLRAISAFKGLILSVLANYLGHGTRDDHVAERFTV
jgi:hypothetical protein